MRWVALWALVVAGCSADGFPEEGVDPRVDFDVPPDGGPPDGPLPDDGVPPRCPGEQLAWGDECIPPPPTEREPLCAYLEAIGAECDDVDGDCYVGACTRPLPPAVRSVADDCDDHRPDVRPDGVEVCDSVDNDCDGDVDEEQGVGEACDACGVEGKLECAVGERDAVACSTAPGQSQGPEVTEELCNGMDDDCDDAIDERCRLDLEPAERWRPVVCGDDVLFVEDGALRSVTAGGEATTLDDGPVAFPACGGAGVAWLQVSAACAAPEGGPLRCARAHLVVEGGVDLTGLAELGPPAVGAERVYWHAIVAGTPVVQRAGVGGGGIESPWEAEALSDPTAPVAGRVAMRAWTGGEAEVIVRRLEDGGQLTVLNNGHAAGPPTLSDRWVVWPVGPGGRSLWAVPLASPRDGFQLTTRDGAQRAPRVDGDRVVWLDEGTMPPTLRSFDLQTGVESALAQADIGPEDYAVSGGVVVWIEDGERVYIERPAGG